MTAADLAVLVGAGQLIDRPDRIRDASSPLSMMQSTAHAAAADAGIDPGLLALLDTLVVVNSVGPRLIANPPAALAARIGASRAETFLTVTGGNTPQALVNHFGREIAAGRRSMVLLSGAEALDSLVRASKSGEQLGWENGEGGTDEPTLLWPDRSGSNDCERAHGMVAPIVTYPLFENALRRHYGRSTQIHQRAIGELFAPFTQVAACNPYAWFPTVRGAAEIATPSADNRYIGFPYTKYMNAVIQVNQSASVLMMSESKAMALGIDRSRWVYLHGCCDIHDVWHVSERVDFHSSPAFKLGLDAALHMAGVNPDEIDHFDVYSCFPAVVEIARDALGMAPGDSRVLTVTGGLPYFGGAGNNYCMHAIAEMADRLRSRPGERGLVTGNGWYLTKHSLGVYGTDRPQRSSGSEAAALQARIDAMPHPTLDVRPSGNATVETYTVMFDRDGRPERGLVLGRLSTGRRFIANVEGGESVLEAMTRHDPVGEAGRVSPGGATNRFEFLS